MTEPAEHHDLVKGSPVKSFFVSMLTRDIDLEDAILDLLDNCVDGILRTRTATGSNDSATPYAGKRASIDITKDSFTISDNCGGIPWQLRDYAFRMGRPPGRPPDVRGTVGVYGIGMKRAIFKMGENCLLSSQHENHRYEVHIAPDWLRDDHKWDIPVRVMNTADQEDGTTIVVSDLYDGIRERFMEEAQDFITGLEKRVATHYAYILAKGFSVAINQKPITARPTKLIFCDSLDASGKAIRPFVFCADSAGVRVFLAVGFTRVIPSADEATSEELEKQYSSEDAGWTVLCNDRAVLFCDRSPLTGWGEAGVPRYHTQFIAISGIVEFRSDDSSKLPTTTTKRGIDASAPLYLQVKNKMREGMRLFTQCTYKWKGLEQTAREHIARGDTLTLGELKVKMERVALSATKKAVPPGQQYVPKLPVPATLASTQRRIAFSRDVEDVRLVARYLLDEDGADPSSVGQECFDLFVSEAKK